MAVTNCPDQERVQRELRQRGREVERQAVEQACSRLEAADELTDEREQVLSETAAAIVDGVLARPIAASEDLRGEDLRAIRELYVPP